MGPDTVEVSAHGLVIEYDLYTVHLSLNSTKSP